MIHIWTDGACDADTREGGWAAMIVAESRRTVRISGSVADTTNNRMEYTAIIEGLEYVYSRYAPESHIKVHSDSQLVQGHLYDGYRVNKNFDLVQKLKAWIKNESTPHVEVLWHSRNSTPELRWCDRQAKQEKGGGRSLTLGR